VTRHRSYARSTGRIKSIDQGIWDGIENGSFIPKIKKNGSFIKKPWSQWTNEESEKATFDYCAKIIITSALDSKEFFRIAKCESAKEMWDTLKATHESTTDLKKSKTRRRRRKNKKVLIYASWPKRKMIQVV